MLRVFPALARLASVPLMLPPLPQSTLIGAAYTTDGATRSTTIRLKMLPSVHVRDFMFFSSLLREWRFGLARSGIADKNLQQVQAPERRRTPIASSAPATMRRVLHPSFFCLAGILLVARCCRLAGKVVASPESVARRIVCSCRLFAALRYRFLPAGLRGGYFDHGVVLALPRMFLVARDEQDGTLVTIGVRSKPGNLPSVVDIVCFRYCHVRAGKN